MPILYIGGYSEMDGLQLTCEFTFNKKEKKENFSTAVLRCFTLLALEMCCTRWTFFHIAPLKKTDTVALRNWIARLPVLCAVIGGLGGPLGDELETGAVPCCVWELLVCLASIQKSSAPSSTEWLECCVNRGLQKCLNVTYVHSGRSYHTTNRPCLISEKCGWLKVFLNEPLII